MEGILPDGASINETPGFNGEHYSFGRLSSGSIRCRTPKKEEEYDDNDKKLVTLNMKAIHMLQSALGQKEYFRICTLPSAKQMWDALEIAHEGIAAIKENRINTLMIEYDLLRMKPGESIGEFQLGFTHRSINSLPWEKNMNNLAK
ncbi:hypothetical protein K1719_000118 [Acacia pycnantha]|nr:hypothetical protein K1719_000118 [Acacia pycnantha]